MPSSVSRTLAGVCLLAVSGWSFLAAEPKPLSPPNLVDYRTVANAVTAKLVAGSGRTGQTGYLGVAVIRDGEGQLVVEDVQIDSPAARAGIKRGDLVLRVGQRRVKTPDEFREFLQTHGAGDSVQLTLKRNEKETVVTATLIALSRPMTARDQRALLGVELGDPVAGKGVLVEQVVPGSGAAKAGLKVGDHLAKVNGEELPHRGRLDGLLEGKKPGDVVTLTVRRDGKDAELKATLSERSDRGRGRRAQGETTWRRDTLRLAGICIEFSDVKHNAKMPLKEWQEALFSQEVFKDRENSQGEKVHGSLSDYCREVSGGKLQLSGKLFDWVTVSKKRDEYQQGSGTMNKSALLNEALDKVLAREGKGAFQDIDGFLFLYAGDRIQTNRGALYYPHAGTVFHQGKRLPYLLGSEGGAKLRIGAFVKELGELLGLPDLAARPENPGSEGLGAWCCMSNPLATTRPQHFSAWAKEKLGWIKPVVIDPTVKQKLILAPIEDSPDECFKVLVRPDSSEYFLLENRRKKGFDSDLPGEGLLIWRVVGDRPILEESHGIEGPSGPLVQLTAVPYPSPANNAFTPETTPSSRSPLGGGLPVRLTEIRRLPDGRITFHIGYQYR